MLNDFHKWPHAKPMHRSVFAEYDLKQVDDHSEWFSFPLIPVLCTQASGFRPLLLKKLIYNRRETKAKDIIPFHMEYSI